MCKLRLVSSRQLLVFCFAILTVAIQANTCVAARVEVRIRVQSVAPPRLIIEGAQDTGTQIWSFRKTYAGLMGLGERISDLVLTDSDGKHVDVRRLGPGEYKAEAPAVGFHYEVNLDPPSHSADSAYISWLTSSRGLLMIGDILPSFSLPAALGLTIELPESWLIASVEKRISRTKFEISDPDRAVFFVGKDLRQLEDRIGRMGFTLATSGEWAFSANELLTIGKSILASYRDSVGAVPFERALLVLSPFPAAETAGRWSAETRGATVVLLSGQQPAKNAALAQVSMPLTHELFHLWVPNGLALDGNYDWFYEGFTIYEAMRTAQQLDFLTFQDFLNGVARAFDSYLAAPDRDQLSLVEASNRRWTTSPSLIYQKAMLVALLYDLTLRSQTKSKLSLETVYRELFRQHRTGTQKVEGNEAVISVLNSLPGMQNFGHDYIKAPATIELTNLLGRFGLRLERVGARTQVFPNEFLSRQQRDLLRGLGYNSETRRPKRNN